jgi:hypothetical protein
MSIEAMKQAREAMISMTGWNDWSTKAFNDLTKAIEQAEKQAVFKIYKPTLPRGAIPNVRDAELPWVYDQDPSSGNVASMWVTPVKATPQPQREWVGLTDEEIEKGRDQTFSINNPYCPCDSKTMRKAVRWAEAKLKEKNHVS